MEVLRKAMSIVEQTDAQLRFYFRRFSILECFRKLFMQLYLFLPHQMSREEWLTPLPETLRLNHTLKPRKISLTLVMSGKHSSKHCVTDEFFRRTWYSVWLTAENMVNLYGEMCCMYIWIM
jgi:hypothetical protein